MLAGGAALLVAGVGAGGFAGSLTGGLAGGLAGGPAGATRSGNAGAPGTLTPPEAHAAVRAGDLILVDVRRPDEWAATGIADGAVPIDLRRDDFVDAVRAVRAARAGRARGGRDVPVAVICARGVRSRRTAAALADAGLTAIVDVPEGMLGSRAGPGWLARGLPVAQP